MTGFWRASLALLALAACAPKPDLPAPDDLRAARQAALTFDQKMSREITARLDRAEDPVAVWLSYADNVPGWGKTLSDAAQMEFSRTALTTRNPSNAPDDWERQQMEQMSFLLDAGLDPDTMEITEILTEGDEKVFRWMRPLIASETCLTCHGERIDNRIKLLIGQEYPLDDAVGYAEGQLLGAYSARKVLSVKGQPPPPYTPQPTPERLPADPRTPDDAPLVQPAEPAAPP